jgi:hypothetical protein
LEVLHLGNSTEDEGAIQVATGKGSGGLNNDREEGSELNESALKTIDPGMVESKEAQAQKGSGS